MCKSPPSSVPNAAVGKPAFANRKKRARRCSSDRLTLHNFAPPNWFSRFITSSLAHFVSSRIICKIYQNLSLLAASSFFVCFRMLRFRKPGQLPSASQQRSPGGGQQVQGTCRNSRYMAVVPSRYHGCGTSNMLCHGCHVLILTWHST